MTDMEKEEIIDKEAADESREIVDEEDGTVSREAEEKGAPADVEEEEKEDPAGAEEEAEEASADAEKEEAPAEADGDEAEADEEDKKKTLFRKKDKKKDKSAEMIADLNDKLRRQMAEFDNFRKRTEREKSQMYEIGAKSVIEKLLPVVDSFERGLAAVPEEAKEDPYVQGMDKIYRQLMTELENLGVKPIEAVGQEFNPDFHNAVMQVENDELESGTVAQELQKGYMYRDSVVRHSMVSVVQ